MLRIPHIRKHTPQSSRQTRRGVHKRAHAFHTYVTHTTIIPSNQARRSQTRQSPPKRHTFKAPTAPHRHNVQPGTTAAYRHKSIPFRPPQSSTLKKARGVCRGAAALRPLCGFPFSSKKILHAIRQKSKRHTVFKKKYF